MKNYRVMNLLIHGELIYNIVWYIKFCQMKIKKEMKMEYYTKAN